MDDHVAGGRRVQDHGVGRRAALLHAQVGLAHRHPGAGAVVVGHGDRDGRNGDPRVTLGPADRVAEGGGVVRRVAVVGRSHGHGPGRIPVVGGEGEAGRLRRHVGVVAAHPDDHVARGPAVEHHRVAGRAAFRDRHRVVGGDRDAGPLVLGRIEPAPGRLHGRFRPLAEAGAAPVPVPDLHGVLRARRQVADLVPGPGRPTPAPAAVRGALPPAHLVDEPVAALVAVPRHRDRGVGHPRDAHAAGPSGRLDRHRDREVPVPAVRVRVRVDRDRERAVLRDAGPPVGQDDPRLRARDMLHPLHPDARLEAGQPEAVPRQAQVPLRAFQLDGHRGAVQVDARKRHRIGALEAVRELRRRRPHLRRGRPVRGLVPGGDDPHRVIGAGIRADGQRVLRAPHPALAPAAARSASLPLHPVDVDVQVFVCGRHGVPLHPDPLRAGGRPHVLHLRRRRFHHRPHARRGADVAPVVIGQPVDADPQPPVRVEVGVVVGQRQPRLTVRQALDAAHPHAGDAACGELADAQLAPPGPVGPAQELHGKLRTVQVRFRQRRGVGGGDDGVGRLGRRRGGVRRGAVRGMVAVRHDPHRIAGLARQPAYVRARRGAAFHPPALHVAGGGGRPPRHGVAVGVGGGPPRHPQAVRPARGRHVRHLPRPGGLRDRHPGRGQRPAARVRRAVHRDPQLEVRGDIAVEGQRQHRARAALPVHRGDRQPAGALRQEAEVARLQRGDVLRPVKVHGQPRAVQPPLGERRRAGDARRDGGRGRRRIRRGRPVRGQVLGRDDPHRVGRAGGEAGNVGGDRVGVRYDDLAARVVALARPLPLHPVAVGAAGRDAPVDRDPARPAGRRIDDHLLRRELRGDRYGGCSELHIGFVRRLTHQNDEGRVSIEIAVECQGQLGLGVALPAHRRDGEAGGRRLEPEPVWMWNVAIRRPHKVHRQPRAVQFALGERRRAGDARGNVQGCRLDRAVADVEEARAVLVVGAVAEVVGRAWREAVIGIGESDAGPGRDDPLAGGDIGAPVVVRVRPPLHEVLGDILAAVGRRR